MYFHSLNRPVNSSYYRKAKLFINSSTCSIRWLNVGKGVLLSILLECFSFYCHLLGIVATNSARGNWPQTERGWKKRSQLIL